MTARKGFVSSQCHLERHAGCPLVVHDPMGPSRKAWSDSQWPKRCICDCHQPASVECPGCRRPVVEATHKGNPVTVERHPRGRLTMDTRPDTTPVVHLWWGDRLRAYHKQGRDMWAFHLCVDHINEGEYDRYDLVDNEGRE